jgi:hypothetical protein
MKPDLLTILSNSNKDIDHEKLVEYLNGGLSNTERNELEQLMAGSELMDDAMEGLEQVKDKKDIQEHIRQINEDLKKLVEKKKGRRQKRRIKEYPWIYLTLILVLFLCVVGYFLIRQYLHHNS